MRSSTVQWQYVWKTSHYLIKYKWHIISKRWVCLHDKIQIDDWVNFEHTVTKNIEIGDLKLTYFSNRSNNAKINESPLKIVCSSLVKMISDWEWEEFSWCRYWIANSVLITETYFSCDIKTHRYWHVCSCNIWEFIYMG